MPEGLYEKYTVVNNATGERVDGAFVLKPETDRHARVALAAYAESVREENPQLSRELKEWIDLATAY